MAYSHTEEMRDHLSKTTKQWFVDNPEMRKVRGEAMRAGRRRTIPKECPWCWNVFDSYQNRNASCKECAPIQRMDYRLKRLYGDGFGFHEFQEMFLEQDGCCGICNEPANGVKLHVDHCHRTNTVRGLLCGECNLGLGKFKDSHVLLAKAAEYLLESSNNTTQEKDKTW